MTFKYLLLIFVLLCLITPALASPVGDAAQTAIAGGMEQFFIDLADSIFEMSFSGYDDTEGNGTAGYIYNIASYTPDPLGSPAVQGAISWSKSVFQAAYPILLLCAFLAVLLTHYKTNTLQQVEQITGVHVGNKSNILARKAIDGIIVAVFMYLFIYFVFTINNILTKAVMSGIIDSVAPSPDNIILYFMMAVCYLVMAFFFAIRTLFLYLFCGFALVIGFCLLIDFTKETAISMCTYFVQITFFQFITVGYFSASILIIKEITTPLHPDSQMLMYTVMLLGGVYIAIKMILGTKIIRYVADAGKKLI